MAKFTIILFCFICDLVNVCCTCDSMLHLDFILSVTTAGQHSPKNVTIRCSVHDKQQESKDLCDFNISGIIIMKYYENEWNPIVRICETGQFPESISGHPDINGLISDHKSSYLEIQWLDAGPEVFGHYKCVANYQNKSSVRDVLSSKATLNNVIAWNPIQVVEKEFDVFFNMCTVNTSYLLSNLSTDLNTSKTQRLAEVLHNTTGTSDGILENVTDKQPRKELFQQNETVNSNSTSCKCTREGGETNELSPMSLSTSFSSQTDAISFGIRDSTSQRRNRQTKKEILKNGVKYFSKKASNFKQLFESELEMLNESVNMLYQEEDSRDGETESNTLNSFLLQVVNKLNTVEGIVKRMEEKEMSLENGMNKTKIPNRMYVNETEEGCGKLASSLDRAISGIYKRLDNIDEKFHLTSINLQELRINNTEEIIKMKEHLNILNVNSNRVLESLKNFSLSYQSEKESVSRFQPRLSELLKNSSGIASDLHLNRLLTDNMTKSIIASPFQAHSNQWPRGQYSLLKPRSGCPNPEPEEMQWDEGYRNYHTKTYNNMDSHSPDTHLQPPIKSKIDGKNFFTLTFCVKFYTNSSITWPKGKYCINRKGGSCPERFSEGFLIIVEEYINKTREWGGDLTDGLTSDRLYFCCRNDGRPDTPIALPRSSPFYLYRFGLKCQQVEGMKIIEEFIYLHTGVGDLIGGRTPAVSVNGIKMHLCYYEEQYV